MSRRVLPALLVALVSCLVPMITSAQIVRGAVVESATGRAIGDVTVMLIDERGVSVAAALAQDVGRFTLHAPAPGTYQLRVLRIGFRRTQSRPFHVRAGETTEQRIVMPQIPTALARIRVEGQQHCEGMPHGGEALALVWEEVRKAVQAVVLTGDEKQLRMRVRDFTPDVALGSDSASNEQSSEREGLSVRPYVSPTPESILSEGYVRQQADGLWYYAPDADVLLSDSFVNAHCFHLQTEAGSTDSLIGIAFEPVRRGAPPDIRGVLRVDRKTAELRDLEYSYTALPAAAGNRTFGEHIAFQHVPGGGWIIRDWLVRAPVIRPTLRERRSGTGFGTRGITATASMVDSVLTGIHEAGGEVLVARTVGGATAWARSYSVVTHAELRGDGVLAERFAFRVPAPQDALTQRIEGHPGQRLPPEGQDVGGGKGSSAGTGESEAGSPATSCSAR